jgi:UDP-N-acetylglucosamine transferase subunit ALG13
MRKVKVIAAGTPTTPGFGIVAVIDFGRGKSTRMNPVDVLRFEQYGKSVQK